MPLFRGRILGRLRDAAGRAAERAGEVARTVLIGGQSGSGPVMTAASRTFVVSLYRKLIASAVGGLVTFLHIRFGWDLVSFFGDDFEVGLIEALTAYLVWRLPNAAAR